MSTINKTFNKTLSVLLALLLVAVLFPVTLAGAANDPVYRTLDEIQEDGTINIGVFSDKNPYGYVDENGD